MALIACYIGRCLNQLLKQYTVYDYVIYLTMYMCRVPFPKRTLNLADAFHGLRAVVLFMLPSCRAALKPL